jgi:hypothetical protein
VDHHHLATGYVYTYHVFMNITLALDDGLVARARELARQQGTTLNDVIRRYLESLAGARSGQVAAAELQRLWDEHPGHSGGRPFSREDAYEGRV